VSTVLTKPAERPIRLTWDEKGVARVVEDDGPGIGCWASKLRREPATPAEIERWKRGQ